MFTTKLAAWGSVKNNTKYKSKVRECILREQAQHRTSYHVCHSIIFRITFLILCKVLISESLRNNLIVKLFMNIHINVRLVNLPSEFQFPTLCQKLRYRKT